MKARRMVQTVSIQNVCALCLRRHFVRASRRSDFTAFSPQQRNISYSGNKTSPAIGAAVRESDDNAQSSNNWASSPPSTTHRTWGTFANADVKIPSGNPRFVVEATGSSSDRQREKIDTLRKRMGASNVTNTDRDFGTTRNYSEQESLEEWRSSTIKGIDGTRSDNKMGSVGFGHDRSRMQKLPRQGLEPENLHEFDEVNASARNGLLIRRVLVSGSVPGSYEMSAAKTQEESAISEDNFPIRDALIDFRKTKLLRDPPLHRSTEALAEDQQGARNKTLKDVSSDDSHWNGLRRRTKLRVSNLNHMKSDNEEMSPVIRKYENFGYDADYTRSLVHRAVSREDSSYVPFRKVSGMTCYRCGQSGHLKHECPTLKPLKGLTGAGLSSTEMRLSEGVIGNQKLIQSDRSDIIRIEHPEALTKIDSLQPHGKKPPTWGASDLSAKLSARFAIEEVDAKLEKRGKSNRRHNFAKRSLMNEDEDDEVDEAKLEARRERKRLRRQAEEFQPTPIFLPPFISVIHLATALKVQADKFMMKLNEMGFENIHQEHVLNIENASLIAMEFGFDPIMDKSAEEEDLKARPQTDKSCLPHRPPVVTIMGHVDHGKTTILDYLRKSSLVASEHGGITQHIGAFSVEMSSGKTITFLDTPGHAAFLRMRERGANVTDIVILVVAADDSVKPQTLEAIKHAQAAQVPIIVAINKIDKPDANSMIVRQDLARHGIEVEDYGGDVQVVEVSGKTGQGMEELEEAVALQAEILDLRAEIDGPVEGWIIEATKDKSGRKATVLVNRGTLRPGDIVVAGHAWARVRTLSNEAGGQVHEAPPGTPVAVEGWREQPAAGDEVLQAPSEKKANYVVALRRAYSERLKMADDLDVINEQRRLHDERRQREKEAANAIAAEDDEEGPAKTLEPKIVPSASELTAPVQSFPPVLYFLLKADVMGSVEAVQASILSIPLQNQPVQISVLAASVGSITESDVAHAAAAPKGAAIIVTFNVPNRSEVIQLAEQSKVKFLEHNIIYRLVDDVRRLVEANLPPLLTKRVTGEAEVLKVFSIGIGGRRKMQIAGCKVRNGLMLKGGRARVYRGVNVGDQSELVYDGTISSLKNVKKDVSEMRKGTECGMAFDDWQGFEAGDQVQCYEEHSEPRKLS